VAVLRAAFFATTFFTAAFSTAGFFATTGTAAAAAFFAAQRFLSAATIAALPAALSLRCGFAVPVLDGDPGWPLDSAQRFRCASPMRFRTAALIFRRLPF
jgi:hypothetical protein